MKRYDAILFDMDGTLVPMDMKEFTKGYFVFLNEKVKRFNIPPEMMTRSIWHGTSAMVRNDGSATNEAVFWNDFRSLLQLSAEDEKEMEALLQDFYGNEFNQAIRFTQPNPLARAAVETAWKKADKVVLATNPLFPMVGQRSRMSWVGLSEEDFALVSCYESDRFCKPNSRYFEDVCSRVGVPPEKCLMIGNDELEDMYCASALGMDCFLVTDTMIPCPDHPWEGKKGSFADLVAFLEGLPE